MVFRTMVLGMVLLALAGPARAQTILNLSATGQQIAAPDEMTASLQVQAAAPRASAAQTDVNQAMQQALTLARAVDGVTATTSGYNVSNDTQSPPPQFQASQDLQLLIAAPDGKPPQRFLDLLGTLQDKGLLLNNLDGTLSPAAMRRAQQSAIADAIAQLQDQAAIIAAQLHEKIGTIKSMDVNINAPVGPRMMMLAKAAPQSAPDKITVDANVSAVIALTEGK